MAAASDAHVRDRSPTAGWSAEASREHAQVLAFKLPGDSGQVRE